MLNKEASIWSQKLIKSTKICVHIITEIFPLDTKLNEVKKSQL